MFTNGQYQHNVFHLKLCSLEAICQKFLPLEFYYLNWIFLQEHILATPLSITHKAQLITNTGITLVRYWNICLMLVCCIWEHLSMYVCICSNITSDLLKKSAILKYNNMFHVSENTVSELLSTNNCKNCRKKILVQAMLELSQNNCSFLHNCEHKVNALIRVIIYDVIRRYNFLFLDQIISSMVRYCSLYVCIVPICVS